MTTPGSETKSFATEEEQVEFISMIQPGFSNYAAQYGFYIVSFPIAQACYESGWGFSSDAVYQHNILGIGPHKYYDSWDACINGYYTDTVLGRMDSARDATTLDEYFQAFCDSGYLGGDGQEGYYQSLRSIIDHHDLTQYDGGKGGRSNKCEEFVQKALSYVGTGSGEWSSLHPNWYDAGVWCADFVSAVGEEVGILGEIFDGSASAYTCAHSVEKYGGSVHDEDSYAPQRGDLINFMWGGGKITGGYADHIGIVTDFDGSTVYTVEGNTSDMVAERSYDRSSSVLACFCHPNWPVSSSSGGRGGSGGQLYEELNTREDAILREVCYVTVNGDAKLLPSKTLDNFEDTKKKELEALPGEISNRMSNSTKNNLISASIESEKQQLADSFASNNTTNESNSEDSEYYYIPTLEETSLKYSIGNYTELFATYWAVYGKSTAKPVSDYSDLEPKVREIIEFFVSKNLNDAAACGIVSNIFYDSEFDTSLIRDSHYGLCQWSGDKAQEMMKSIEGDWQDNLTGQLKFLYNDFTALYPDYMSMLKGLDDNKLGAKQAAKIFATVYKHIEEEIVEEDFDEDSENVEVVEETEETEDDETSKDTSSDDKDSKEKNDDEDNEDEVDDANKTEIQKRQDRAVKYYKKIVKVLASTNYGSQTSTSSKTSASIDINLNNLDPDRKARVERAFLQLERTERGEVYYSWGGCGPDGFDCSGFVSYCLTGEYSRVGTTNTFMGWENASNPLPGDVCTNWEHCGLYIGNDEMLHCTSYGDVSGVIRGPVQSGMIIVLA